MHVFLSQITWICLWDRDRALCCFVFLSALEGSHRVKAHTWEVLSSGTAGSGLCSLTDSVWPEPSLVCRTLEMLRVSGALGYLVPSTFPKSPSLIADITYAKESDSLHETSDVLWEKYSQHLPVSLQHGALKREKGGHELQGPRFSGMPCLQGES